ncbi:TRM11 family methyltransferase [Gluconobacter oxydans]|uniref:hypothetical protein n=1 Tax=Gluconobacter oxydans TaxID=442 RepID=UPI00346402D9
MRASGYERHADDWYVEPAWAVDALLQAEQPFNGLVSDPCCGSGNIPDRLEAHGVKAIGSDRVDRADGKYVVADFRAALSMVAPASIVSNPPYGVAQAFVEEALGQTTDRVAVLLRLAFLEGVARGEWFKTVPLARVWVSSRRMSMPPGGSGVKAKNGTVAFAWFVFEHGHSGAPAIGWI